MNHPATVKEDRTNFVIFHPIPCFILPSLNNPLKSVSIDVGIKNLAIRIEIRSRSGIQPVYFRKIDLTEFGENTNKTNGTAAVDPNILEQCNKLIFEILPYMADAVLIGIERQMTDNIKAVRMYQHFISTYCLLIKLGMINNQVILFDIYAKLKYTQLGCPTELNTDAKKKWSIVKAKDLLTKRGDAWSLQVIAENQGKSDSKGDDLADTVCQMEAWFLLNRIS